MAFWDGVIGFLFAFGIAFLLFLSIGLGIIIGRANVINLIWYIPLAILVMAAAFGLAAWWVG